MKYKLAEIEGETNFRALVCVTAFDDIKAGQVGGLIGSDVKLQDGGNWWVDLAATVDGYSSISGNVRVKNSAFVKDSDLSGEVIVRDHAYVSDSKLSGKTTICDRVSVVSSDVSGHVHILGSATVKFSQLSRFVMVKDNAYVFGQKLTNNTVVCGHEILRASR